MSEGQALRLTATGNRAPYGDAMAQSPCLHELSAGLDEKTTDYFVNALKEREGFSSPGRAPTCADSDGFQLFFASVHSENFKVV